MPTNFPFQTGVADDIVFSMNTQNQVKKYKEEELAQKAPQELPFKAKDFSEIFSQIHDRLMYIKRQVDKIKAEPRGKTEEKNNQREDALKEIGNKIDVMNRILLIELPEFIDILELSSKIE